MKLVHDPTRRVSCDPVDVSCHRRDRGEAHKLPTRCLDGHVDEYGFSLFIGACGSYRPCEHYREAVPGPDGRWYIPLRGTAPMGYAPPVAACAAKVSPTSAAAAAAALTLEPGSLRLDGGLGGKRL